MTVQIERILDELQSLKDRVADLERDRSQYSNVFPLPAKKGSPALRLIAMARTNPEAAKAEAKRLAKKDSKIRRMRGEI